MKRTFRIHRIVAGAVFLAATCSSLALADGLFKDFVAMSDVPAKVESAAAVAAPGVQWSFAQEIKGGYSLLGKETAGKQRIVVCMSDGTRAVVRVDIEQKDVTGAAQNALAAKHAGFQVKIVQTAGFSMQSLTHYRFIGKRADGKESVVMVSLDGRKVTEE